MTKHTEIKVQANVSAREALMLRMLAEASGHPIETLTARAITTWLENNWSNQMDLYALPVELPTREDNWQQAYEAIT